MSKLSGYLQVRHSQVMGENHCNVISQMTPTPRREGLKLSSILEGKPYDYWKARLIREGGGNTANKLVSSVRNKHNVKRKL